MPGPVRPGPPLEQTLGRVNPVLVRLAARPALMKLAALALDRPIIQTRVVAYVKRRYRLFLADAMKNAARPGEVSR